MANRKGCTDLMHAMTPQSVHNSMECLFKLKSLLRITVFCLSKNCVTVSFHPTNKKIKQHQQIHSTSKFLVYLTLSSALKGTKNKYRWIPEGLDSHSNSISSSASSLSMFTGSGIGPSAAKRTAISFSVLSRSCFFFSWIFLSL